MSEDQARDEHAAMLAAFDQAKAANAETASTVASYFHSLCEGGLERTEALILTQQFQQLYVGTIMGLVGIKLAQGEGQ